MRDLAVEATLELDLMDDPFEHNECPAAGAASLTACYFRAKEPFRADGWWKCPHCAELNREPTDICGCGFELDNLDGFADQQAFSIAKLIIVLAL